MSRLVFLIMMVAVLSARAAAATKICSPDGRIVLSVAVSKGKVFYELERDGAAVMKPSALGFVLADGRLDSGFAVAGTDTASHDDTWRQVWGEDEYVRNHYNELTLHLVQKHGKRRRLDIVFRAFDDGIGFRYVIPAQPTVGRIAVKDEVTQFSLTHDAYAWSIPTNRTQYFEGIYTRQRVSDLDTVCTPLTIEYEPGLYMAIHEAALEDYAGINLASRGTTLVTALTPWSDGTKVYASQSMKSPWRIIMMADTPGGLITSRMMLNLNEPCRITDTSWIEPGKYVGIWWSIHKKKNTWEMGPKHGATTANVKRYIDFAARHGFSGVLAEGWNYGWGQGEQLSFLKAYPDFDIAGVADYALGKGLRFIAHMESWGNARLIEEQMDSAFAWYASMGIRVVKTGYVGRLMDGRELSASQYGIRHYRKVVEAAARHHIMIDNHEPAMPTGLQRTYPNLMTQEGVRGQEYNAWDTRGGNPPEHTATLPFTRCLAGPVDFTPAIFNFSEVVEGAHPHSTLAKQLAEFVVLYSPLQMAADEIANYEFHPALSFIESCPTTWSKTVVPNGVIGSYVTIARKERGGDTWFVGSLTGSDSREISLKLDFLDRDAVYEAFVYEDGEGADYQANPYSMGFRQVEVTAASVLSLRLARGGGAAIRIVKVR